MPKNLLYGGILSAFLCLPLNDSLTYNELKMVYYDDIQRRLHNSTYVFVLINNSM